MGELLRRMREPLAWLLLAVTVLYVVLDLIRFGWSLGHDKVGLAVAARSTGNSVGLVWVLLDLGIVLCCVLIDPPVRRARAVTLAAALVVSVVSAYDLFLLVVGLIGGGSALGRVLEAIGGFLEVLCKGVIAVILWRLWALPRTWGDGSFSGSGSGGSAPDPASGSEPLWQQDEAVTMTWDRAEDAARGLAGHGVPGSSQGAAPVQPDEGQTLPDGQDWTRGSAASLSSLRENFADPGIASGRARRPWASAAEQAAGLGPQVDPQPSGDDSGESSDPPRWTPLPPEQD